MHSQQMVTEAAQDEVVLELRNTKHRGGGFEMTIHAGSASGGCASGRRLEKTTHNKPTAELLLLLLLPISPWKNNNHIILIIIHVE
jgi:hypothetical protein